MGVGGQRHAPAALPPGKAQYPLHVWMGGHQCQSEHVQNIVPPLGLNPQTAQSVVSRYSNYAFLATPKCVCIPVKLIQYCIMIERVKYWCSAILHCVQLVHYRTVSGDGKGTKSAARKTEQDIK